MLGAIKKILSVGLQLFTGIGAVKQDNTVVQKVTDFLTQATDVITDVANIDVALKGSLSDEQRLAAAAALMEQLVLKHPALIGHKVKDAEMFKAGVADLTQGIFGIVKSLDDGAVQTVNKAA